MAVFLSHWGENNSIDICVCVECRVIHNLLFLNLILFLCFCFLIFLLLIHFTSSILHHFQLPAPTMLFPSSVPSLLSKWGPTGYMPLAILQVSARLGDSSPIEAWQCTPARRAYPRYVQQLLGYLLFPLFRTHMKARLYICCIWVGRH